MDNTKELDVMADITHASLDFTKDEVDEICSALAPKPKPDMEAKPADDVTLPVIDQRKRKLSVDKGGRADELEEDRGERLESKRAKGVRQGSVEVSAFSVFKCFDGMGSCSTILRKINRKINDGASVCDQHSGKKKRQRAVLKNPALTPAKHMKLRSNHQRKTKISPAGRPTVCDTAATKQNRSRNGKKPRDAAVADPV